MEMNNQNNNEQNPYSQNPYSQNAYYQQSYGQQQPAKDETVSVLDWIGTTLILCIPCVGLIVYIVWAFSSNTKKSKANFCKAYLLILLAVIVIYMIMFGILFATVGAEYMTKASMM